MIGGAFFLIGMLLMAYNVWRTVRHSKAANLEAAAQTA
jgi:cytochrome c oxidase cbb3-type subunit 1